MIKFIKNKLAFVNTIQSTQTDAKLRTDECIAAAQVFSLLNDCPYLPFSKSSLNFTSLAVMLNDIVVNDRKTIVEFGSGISTFVIAKLIKRNNLKGVTLISVENDNKWLSITRSLLEAENLNESVIFVYSPLKDTDISLDGNKWYDKKAISSVLNTLGGKVDCVLVDGPAAWYKEVFRSRYPALPFLLEYLNSNCVIFLDDTNRAGEQEILEMWKEYGFKKEIFNYCFTGLFRGDYFNVTLP